jgi:hypothetical protein
MHLTIFEVSGDRMAMSSLLQCSTHKMDVIDDSGQNA